MPWMNKLHRYYQSRIGTQSLHRSRLLSETMTESWLIVVAVFVKTFFRELVLVLTTSSVLEFDSCTGRGFLESFGRPRLKYVLRFLKWICLIFALVELGFWLVNWTRYRICKQLWLNGKIAWSVLWVGFFKINISCFFITLTIYFYARVNLLKFYLNFIFLNHFLRSLNSNLSF